MAEVVNPKHMVHTVTIANGAAVSPALDLSGWIPVGIVMPAAWTAADIAFLASVDDATYVPLYDVYGAQISVKANVSTQIQLDPTVFAGVRFLKLQSGLTGATVNQGAARTITLIARKVE